MSCTAGSSPARCFGRWPLAGLAPAAIFIAYFAVVSPTGPVAWTAHLIVGTVLIAALTGLAPALLARPTHDRVPPDEAAPRLR